MIPAGIFGVYAFSLHNMWYARLTVNIVPGTGIQSHALSRDIQFFQYGLGTGDKYVEFSLVD